MKRLLKIFRNDSMYISTSFCGQYVKLGRCRVTGRVSRRRAAVTGGGTAGTGRTSWTVPAAGSGVETRRAYPAATDAMGLLTAGQCLKGTAA